MSGPSADVSRPRAPRHVRFAATSSMTLVEPLAADLYYSKRELDRQKERLKDDARRMGARLSKTAMPALPREELYECVGIETLLSRDALRSARRHKTGHVRAVLATQARQRRRKARQRRRKDHDEEELARASRKSSERSVHRAKKRAAAYWRVLE